MQHEGRPDPRNAAIAFRYGCMESPLGTVWVAAGPDGVLRVALGSLDEAAWRADLRRRWPRAAFSRDDGRGDVAAALRQLSAYFARRRRVFTVAIDLRRCSGFQRRVLERVREVPWGTVASYGQIAISLGQPGAARAVGGALSRNPVPLLVPCHRVVGGSGGIGGFTVGADPRATGAKRALLDLERGAGDRA